MSTSRRPIPPPLVTAASLVAVEGVVLVLLAGVGLLDLASDRVSAGVSLSVFFAVYGAVLLASAAALVRRQGWARGPVLMTQLVLIGLAWNLRDVVLLAVVMAVSAVVVLVGMLSRASIEALAGE